MTTVADIMGPVIEVVLDPTIGNLKAQATPGCEKLPNVRAIVDDVNTAIINGLPFKHDDGSEHYVNPITCSDPKTVEALTDDINRRFKTLKINAFPTPSIIADCDI